MPEPGNNNAIQKWVRIAFVNLLIVAVLGVIMRYKIAYYLPFIEQKNFLHAHSHFAFSGWASQVLMILMWTVLNRYLPGDSLKKYKWLLAANLVSAYGMLITFPWEGYGVLSIIFSTLSILVSYGFAVAFWIDLDKIEIKIISKHWFKASLVFSVMSSFGAFFLSYMMANKIQHPNWFLASTYYFLHFQYNGWFLFASMGLLNEQFKDVLPVSLQKQTFRIFAAACIPAYFLSVLWLPIPGWVYALVVFAAVTQLFGWMRFMRSIMKNKAALFENIPNQTKWLFILPAIALSIKLLLQAGSTISFLSHLAFGFRPVVIGYLHLMFLGVISLFIIGFCSINKFIIVTKRANTGIILFITGIIINEFLLMIQGLSYMNYLIVPYINELLLGTAICMFCGVLLLLLGLKKGVEK